MVWQRSHHHLCPGSWGMTICMKYLILFNPPTLLHAPVTNGSTLLTKQTVNITALQLRVSTDWSHILYLPFRLLWLQQGWSPHGSLSLILTPVCSCHIPSWAYPLLSNQILSSLQNPSPGLPPLLILLTHLDQWASLVFITDSPYTMVHKQYLSWYASVPSSLSQCEHLSSACIPLPPSKPQAIHN